MVKMSNGLGIVLFKGEMSMAPL